MKKFSVYFCMLFLIFSLTSCGTSLSDMSSSEAIESNLTESYQSESSSGTHSSVTEEHPSYDGNYPQHEAYGTGVGTMPGRVVWEHDPESVKWDGSGYWWETKHFNETVIQKMVDDSIASLSGKETAKDGWNALFTSNKESRNMNGGYRKGEKIAIKANINLKGHSYGITLCGKNHFGSFINGNALRPPEGANLHQCLTKSEMGIYSPLVDLIANSDLGGKTVLYMLDAIICAPSEGASITEKNSKWKQAPFDDYYTASIFVSQDPVAIDSVGADFLNNEPTITKNNIVAKDITNENYLHEAGLISNAPSETNYSDGNGHNVENLGVHEHWNDSVEKLYSRNLGKDEGIELIQRINVLSSTILGDVNSDEEFNIFDIVLFQKWLLCVPNVKIVNWKAADLCKDALMVRSGIGYAVGIDGIVNTDDESDHQVKVFAG